MLIKVWGIPLGAETSVTPDVVDAVDVGDAVEGVGVHAWRRPRRVRRVGWWYTWWLLDVTDNSPIAMRTVQLGENSP